MKKYYFKFIEKRKEKKINFSLLSWWFMIIFFFFSKIFFIFLSISISIWICLLIKSLRFFIWRWFWLFKLQKDEKGKMNKLMNESDGRKKNIETDFTANFFLSNFSFIFKFGLFPKVSHSLTIFSYSFFHFFTEWFKLKKKKKKYFEHRLQFESIIYLLLIDLE